jgi:hypothetical protein
LGIAVGACEAHHCCNALFRSERTWRSGTWCEYI